MLRDWLQLLYPAFCQVCECPLSVDQDDFCPNCRHELIHDPSTVCPRCAASIGAYSDTLPGCSYCRDEKFAFSETVRMNVYQSPIKDLILRMKHSLGFTTLDALADVWVDAMIDRLKIIPIDGIIPVPLHWTRRLHRGFNIADVLAERLAIKLRKPLLDRVIRRIRATPRQMLLPPEERRKNVLAAFRVTRPAAIIGRSLLVIDDVLTTGTTLNEVARCLKKAGASVIRVAIIARGGMPERDSPKEVDDSGDSANSGDHSHSGE